MRILVSAAILLVAGVVGRGVFVDSRAAAESKPPQPVDFVRDVQPILAAHCYECHGPVTQKGKLRWDRRESVRAHKKMLVPGKPQASELIEVLADDADAPMPPPGKGKPLSTAQVALLTRWIAEGAVWPDDAAEGPDPRLAHWAFKKPVRSPLPKVTNTGWAKNPIDVFILARLEKEGLKPSPEADKYALARRAAIDLTGLPPTIEEADRLANDPSPDAYERYVDRLLASPAYGERWAALWLDLARYADSNGYANDNARTIWRWRDWVIDAINTNMPYDRFTTEQLAGDMLPNATKDQILATAFHRNTLSNDEGGTDDEEFRVAAVNDRVSTTFQVWMGMTMACAQCHDHKYDPLTQEEYYKAFAVFNNTEDADKDDNRPLLEVFTPDQEQERARLNESIAAAEKQLADPHLAFDAAQAKWEATTLAKLTAPATSPSRAVGKYVRIDLPGKKRILSLAEVQVFSAGRNVALKGKATQAGIAHDGDARLAIDGNTNGHYFDAKSTTHTAPGDNPWWEVELPASVGVDQILVWNRTDGTGERLNDFSISVLDEKHQPVWFEKSNAAPSPKSTFVPGVKPAGAIPANVATILRIRSDQRTAEQSTELRAHFRATAEPTKPVRDQLTSLKTKLAAIKPVTTPVMRELAGKDRRESFILNRGNFLDRGAKVTEGVPAVFPQPKASKFDRLTLAQWLVSPENPLTARVTVNRYWEQVFGLGIVETSEDFGVRSKPPTHPQLLDYLAVDFRESGWDVKRLLRTILTSAAYRQSTKVTPELLARDPNNILLARGPRFRSTAEMVRDQALFAAGLLSKKIHGPPVRPPRPKLGLNAAFAGSTDWEDSKGEDRYRRALYTQWRRTTPYPAMMTFDASNRTVCTLTRPRTNTPLQALVTMNDPAFVEAAQALGRRMVNEGGDTTASRITHGFRLCLTRPPTGAELQRLVTLFQATRAKYANDPKAAEQMATVPIGPLPPNANAPDYAAWSVLGNVLLNLDEIVAKR